MRESERLRTTMVAGACACLLALTGCSVDGSAHRGDDAPRESIESSDARQSPGVDTAEREGASPSRSAGDADTTDPSRAGTSTAPSSGTSGAAAKAWDMTCTDYNRLSPEEAQAVTAELGRRLNKKQLVENSRSWAIVKEFCKDGLVRNSPGVRDSG